MSPPSVSTQPANGGSVLGQRGLERGALAAQRGNPSLRVSARPSPPPKAGPGTAVALAAIAAALATMNAVAVATAAAAELEAAGAADAAAGAADSAPSSVTSVRKRVARAAASSPRGFAAAAWALRPASSAPGNGHGLEVFAASGKERPKRRTRRCQARRSSPDWRSS